MATARAILRVVSAAAVGPTLLDIEFSDGTRKRIDVRPLLRGPVFEPLLDSRTFARLFVDPISGTTIWPTGADFAPEALYALPPVANGANSGP